MEDENNKLQVDQEQTSPSENINKTKVGFPQVERERSGKGKKIFIFILIFLILGIIGWFLFGKERNIKVDRDVEQVSQTEETTPTPTEELVDREEIKIQVLNGTGISGAAGVLKGDLEKLGYSDIKVGNVDKQDYESAEVIFNSSLSETVKKEILDALKDIYKDINQTTEDLKDFDVEIITGYPINYTPTPTVKPNLSPTSTSTPTPTPY